MNLRLLKEKNFLLLMVGKLVSLIGTRAQSFALSLYVLGVTGSATKFASILAITFIPNIILGPIAGVFVDWFHRKKIIVIMDFISGIVTAIFAVLFLIKGSLSMPDIYILVIIMAIASLVFQPAITTVIPSIVEKDDLVDANSINTVIMNGGNLLAPAFAGLIFGIYGLAVILILNSISFILSAVSEMFIDIPKTNRKPEKISFKAFKGDFMEGVHYIAKKKIIFNIILIGMIMNFLFQPLGGIGRVFVATNVLGFSNSQYGMIESILVTALFLSPFVASWISKKMELGKIFTLDGILISVYGVLLALMTTNMFLSRFSQGPVPYIVFTIIGFLTVFTTSVGNICLMTLFQKEVELSVMGRVNTVMVTIATAITPLGQMLFGYLFDTASAWFTIALGSILMFILMITLGRKLYGKGVNTSKKSNESLELACSEEKTGE